MESDSLYNDIILEYSDFPRNKRLIDAPDGASHGTVANCADDLIVTVKLTDKNVQDIAWEGTACAIGRASATMMTETLSHLDADDARRWIERVRAFVTGHEEAADVSVDLGDIEALQGVRKLPVRIKCALLPWDAANEAIGMAERKQGAAGE
jgi:nitrogen fixation NifU-like protein